MNVMTGQQIMTTDPVSTAEIAERVDAKLALVQAWVTRGLLGEPDWVLGRKPIWAWERACHLPIIAQRLGTHDWSYLMRRIPVRDRYAILYDIPMGSNQSTQRRIERHKTVLGEPCGYLSFPTENGMRGFITDDLTGTPGAKLGGIEYVRAIAGSWIDDMPRLRRADDLRDPSVSPNWPK